jgi:hypothetical protein
LGWSGRGWSGFDGIFDGCCGHSVLVPCGMVANKRNRSVSFRIRFTGRTKDSDFWDLCCWRGET